MELRPLLDLLYPRTCLACGDSLLGSRFAWLCAGCLARIDPLGASPCPVCAGDLGEGAAPSACRDCGRLRPRFDGAVAVGRYDGLLRELVTRLKYGRDAALAWPLGELLAETVRLWERGREPEVVVPVPQRVAKRVTRGFNHAELIAVEVARRLRLPVRRHALLRRGAGRPQASLPRTSRLTEPRGSMRVLDSERTLAPTLARLPPALAPRVRRLLAPAVRARRILLVDDVLTTGATVNEAARALRAGGAGEVLVAVVARA